MCDKLFDYVIRLADDHLILGQRLGEWCGHAPNLEEDIGMTNIALDLIGQARSLYAYAGELDSAKRSEDELAFLRPERDYRNALLVEQPNGDFAVTMMRQLLFSAFMEPFWTAMENSSDETLAAIAAKAVKETAYHLRHSAEWCIRLGDGTEESHRRVQAALDQLWPFTDELFERDAAAKTLHEAGIGVDAAALKPAWQATIDDIIGQATLEIPQQSWMRSGGRQGLHSEHFGHLLSELQYMQRTFPDMQW